MNFELYPVSFYAVVLLTGIGIATCVPGLKQGWGLPAIIVLLTVGAWYVADALYNDYEEYFWQFGLDTLNEAWLQVALFVLTFTLVVRPFHASLNRKLADHESFTMRTYEEGVLSNDQLQHNIDRIFALLALAWVILMVVGLNNCNWDFAGLFAPYWVGYTLSPWNRGRMGANFDALLSFASYAQIFITASLGLVAAISRNPLTRFFAGLLFFLTVPMYVFDRTRNKMLAVLVPGAVAWVFLRLKASWPVKAVILGAMAVVLNFWMLFVLANRSDIAIARAIHSDEAFEAVEDAKHVGLNMFEELAHINQFMKSGGLEPTWGGRYFAELVNPIPRALWPGKPTAGLEYAILRGMDYGRAGDSASGGGVVASISTGMIGQGVMNFGRFLGPIAAALLMALWVALLARQDLLSQDNVVRFLLYALGLILTFNMGRDITFLVVFPFVCGYAVLLWSEKKRGTTGGWTPESRGQRSEIGGRRSGDRGQRSEVRDQGAEVGASVFQGTGVSVSEGETVDGRRDVGAGGTVRTMPTQQPKRIARWMPRRVRAAIVAARSGGEGEGLKDHETKRPKDQETARGQSSEVGGEENGERPRDGRERPRQLAVPYRNYRRYRA